MPTDLALRPLSTRSVVLSLLLAVHPPQLSVRELIRCVQPLGIAEATLRVALSRMVADGDVHRADPQPPGRPRDRRQPPADDTPPGRPPPADGPPTTRQPSADDTPPGRQPPANDTPPAPQPPADSTPPAPHPPADSTPPAPQPPAGSSQRAAPAVYALGERLLDRQRRQDEAIDPATKAWRGGWEMAVVTATGRSPAQRAQLREELTRLRLAELREGVWLRPDNLRRAWPDEVAGATRRFVARPDEPHDTLIGALWTVGAWADRATALLDAFEAATKPAESFTVAAAIVRHLGTDPVLPEQLLPGDWPGGRLRTAYAKYQREVMALARAVSRARC